MTIYDYYEPEKYYQITYDCSDELKRRKETDNPIAAFEYLLYYSKVDKEFKKQFPIDNKGCLFYLISKYATNKKERKRILEISDIKDFKIEKNTNNICTILGDTKFKLFLKTPLDILIEYIETDAKMKVLRELYQGKLYQYCHYASVELGKNYDIVSAFVPGKFENHRFIHSFLEKENTVYDVSNNLVMTKDNYYNLLTPELVSNISGEELYELFQSSEEDNIERMYIDYIDDILDKRKTKH